MIRVAGLSFLLGSANNVGLILYAKELDYRRSALYSHVPQLFSMVVSVGLAVWLRSAWALVLAQVAAAAVMLPISYWAHPFRPRLRPRREALRHLLRYGRYVAGSAPLFYLSGRIDDVVVGRRFGSHSLGAYHVAYNTSALPAIYFSEVVLSIAFPILARLQADATRLAGVYKQTLRHVANVALPSAVFLWLLAPELVRALYGGKWDDAAPLLAAFSLYGALRSVAGIPFQLYRATGRTDLLMRFGFLNLLVVGWVILIASTYGPFWMAMLLSVMSVPVTLYGFDLSAEILGVSRREIRSALSGGLIASLGAGVVTWAVLLAFDDGILWPIVVGAVTFAPVYVAILTAFDRRWLPELRDMLGTVRKT